MAEPTLNGALSRRQVLIAAAAACSPLADAQATGVYTPHEVAEHYAQRVAHRLRPPPDREVLLYGAMTEFELMSRGQALPAPQYLLVVDSCPHVQAAFLFWRLLPGHYRLVGASPVSTGGPALRDHFQTPQGVFEQSAEGNRSAGAGCERAVEQTCRRDGFRVFDFGWQRARKASKTGELFDMRLQARAADRRAERFLGSARSDGCILLPASLIAFLDEFGLLDATSDDSAPRRPIHQALPYRGRYLLVLDTGRDERPDWSPAPV